MARRKEAEKVHETERAVVLASQPVAQIGKECSGAAIGKLDWLESHDRAEEERRCIADTDGQWVEVGYIQEVLLMTVYHSSHKGTGEVDR